MSDGAERDDAGAAESKSALTRFRWFAVMAGAAGVGLIVVSSCFEAGSTWADALRETGGAVIAGAVLAWLVVQFEEAREQSRTAREVAREARQAALARSLEDLADERARAREDEADRRARQRDEAAARLRRRVEAQDRVHSTVHVDLVPARRHWLDRAGIGPTRAEPSPLLLGHVLSDIIRQLESAVPSLASGDEFFHDFEDWHGALLRLARAVNVHTEDQAALDRLVQEERDLFHALCEFATDYGFR